MKTTVICALYKFVTLENHESLRQPLIKFMTDREIKGTLLLSREGINGTVAGSRESIDALLDYLRSDKRLAGVDYKESFHDVNPFYRTKVRLKKEIVTMGVEDIDPHTSAGTYVEPRDWNKLISDPDTLLIDTRNEYEVAIGTFRNAVNPHTDTFREFPEYVEKNLNPAVHKKVAMFCTGGIRCEKSTAYLKSLGFDEVFHLKGGILRYLEEVAEEQSLWQGDCFVFDNRVSVRHALLEGTYDQCHACRMPISEEDKQSALYEKGVSCPYCHERATGPRVERLRERERQIRLAKERGEEHIGGSVRHIARRRRAHKKLMKQQASEENRT